MNRITKRRAIALAVAAAMTLSSHALAQNFGAWHDTTPDTVNTPSAEGCPIESQDGLSLYIASNRSIPGVSQGALDIYRFRRATEASPWGLAENLGATVNSSQYDYCPTPLQGKWLLFVSSKDTGSDADPSNDDCLSTPPVPPPPGSPAPGDIFLTQENPSHGWLQPLHLGCYPNGPNTAGYEYSPSLVHTASGTVLFFSSNGYPGGAGHDIYMSRVLDDGTVTVGMRVDELSSGAADIMPNVRKDGLEIVFSSNRGNADPFNQDIYIATRNDTADAWGTPQKINDPAINTLFSETRASLSGDGTRLHFGRKEFVLDPGDVYVSTRSK